MDESARRARTKPKDYSIGYCEYTRVVCVVEAVTGLWRARRVRQSAASVTQAQVSNKHEGLDSVFLRYRSGTGVQTDVFPAHVCTIAVPTIPFTLSTQ